MFVINNCIAFVLTDVICVLPDLKLAESTTDKSKIYYLSPMAFCHFSFLLLLSLAGFLFPCFLVCFSLLFFLLTIVKRYIMCMGLMLTLSIGKTVIKVN
jgi:hypothetical protein